MTPLLPLDDTAVLRNVRALLATEAQWTVKTYARDAEGKEMLYSDPKATCWCLVGAILHVTPELPNATPEQKQAQVILRLAVYRRIGRAAGMPDSVLQLATLNDEGGYARVVGVLDKALADGG